MAAKKDRFADRLDWAGFSLALTLTVVFLQLFAWHMWGSHLVVQAARTQAALDHGDTPYRWAPRHEGDLVAGRLFGSNAYEFDERGLRVEGNGETFQIGLPYSGAIDLAIFGRLELDAAQGANAQTTLVVREALTSPMRFAAVAAGSSSIDLASLSWTDEFGASVSTPQRLAMLRIQARPPKGEPFRLTGVRVMPTHEKVNYAPWLTIKPGPVNIPEPAPGMVPRYALDLHQKLEAAMAQRDRLLLQAPSALFMLDRDVKRAGQATAVSTAPDESMANLRWPALALYAAALLLLRLRPPRHARLRGALEAAGALAAPFALVIGGFVGDNPDAWVALVAAVSLAFALSLQPVDTLPPWRWLGPPAAWMLSFGAVAVAAAVAFYAHRADHGLHWPDKITLLRYLGWAVLQQYLICVVLADRLSRIGLSLHWIAFCAALVFALLHTPNGALMTATFVGGLIWGAVWVRYRALLPIAASHVASATILLAGLPPEILRSAEVSARFFL